MKIRHVSIRNFRGIRHLEWDVRSDVVCLIGPGDATKSTVLDAIAYTLSPGRFLGVNDADFYAANISEPIVIEVTVTHPPRHLLAESKYGLLQRGWSAEHGLSDDPDPAGDAALTVRLSVDIALEPHWIVTKQANDEGKLIGWKDRAALQLFRIDDNINAHLAWGRGSALAALTADDDEIDSTLTAAHRDARDASFTAPHEKLDAAAEAAYEHAVAFGVPSGPRFPARSRRPRDERRCKSGSSSGEDPADVFGVGNEEAGRPRSSARPNLWKFGLSSSMRSSMGLNRIGCCIFCSRYGRRSRRPEGTPGLGQVILTTHSADAVAELKADELHVVRSADGVHNHSASAGRVR